MGTNKKLDASHILMLRIMLLEPNIKNSLLVDGQIAKEFIINDDGSILIGRSKYGWINKLFNQYDKISFSEVCNRIIVTITPEVGRDTLEMLNEALNNVIRHDDKEKMIDLLLYYMQLIYKKEIYNLIKSNYKVKPQPLNSGIFKGTRTLIVDLGKGGCIPIQLQAEVEFE